MNIGKGLKAIVNVVFWIWIAIGVLITIGGFNGSGLLWFGIIAGIIVPIIIRLVMFYINYKSIALPTELQGHLDFKLLYH